ncbi:SDR family NAD(P)-dependent oxidoreductase [Celeribacter indicus]|uniref:3-oxoacyl-ACP reductase n=1 Tax=Celeribacter indicus TaxID=1208324 RepID=A0A0B5DUR5_9RHOB|nr:SDR family NAD(P)-dependent oxidoreductase [Celeribacter indicus]AJE46769.1 3-oxoacyl-ACP reductase [Celeribacter indicus]SDX05984.1 3-oxoacyl-[acyl-carrier protein] reductase/meso-butanediol dehydrogenase / (S,S)-butanediol dehydrogenase / diacetyl reductase [Celeribacter indicus]
MAPLEGKVALITGAGGMKGVGRAIALELSRQGAAVALTDVARDHTVAPPLEMAAGWKGIESVAAEIRREGGRAACFQCDLTEREQIEVLVGSVANEFGRIDILVNNARAIIGRDQVSVADLDAEVWERFLKINTTAPFLLTKYAARIMIEKGEGGRIINIGSDLSKQARRFAVAYAASKFGLIGLTQGAALDLAEHRITVNAVCPGSVNTDRLSYAEQARAEAEGVPLEMIRSRAVEAAAAQVPMGRIAESEDIAGLVGFLAGPQAGFITGQAYNVNGGQLFH